MTTVIDLSCVKEAVGKALIEAQAISSPNPESHVLLTMTDEVYQEIVPSCLLLVQSFP